MPVCTLFRRERLLHLVFGLDHVVGAFFLTTWCGFSGGRSARGAGIGGGGPSARGGAGGLVDRFAEFHPSLVQVVETALQRVLVLTLNEFFNTIERTLNIAAL